jgi:hypothetical protein
MQSDSIGVERRRLPFTLIENVILEDQALGPVDLLVYLAIAKHADAEGVCWPSLPTIAKFARVHRSSVAQAIKRLEDRGYLKRTARFRPDGGVTSNVYQLMPIEAQKYPPVVQEDTPRRPGRLAPVAQDDANYIQSKQDPTKGETSARTTQPPQQLTSPFPASRPEDQLLAELTDVPGLVHDKRFREGARRLLSQGKTPGELVLAVRTAARDPQECGGLSFVADRFPRWVRKAKEQERQEHLSKQHEDAEGERVERVQRAAEERVRIQAEQDSIEGRQLVEAAIAQLPWRRVRA